ncbi:hypothetical protein B0H66DRAFT_14482 [Apodospora peruviana]|uniref:Uncharacterized protein n=1 Tax=Apodospora peruviana TaxID=516989 RepID=A0AAE0IPX4_9PEZI|nr:hypothetical protein B0H66DRAFT_14482 [Apodospora peruviana]
MAFGILARLGTTLGLCVVALIPLITFWAFSLRRVYHQSKPLKMGHIFLKAAPPVLGTGILLLVISYAITIANVAGLDSSYGDTMTASSYLGVTGGFLCIVGDILITLALYLFGLAVLYIALANDKWWSLLRIDCLVGGAIFLILAIAFWGKRLSDLSNSSYYYGGDSGTRLYWIPVLIDLSLMLLTLGVFVLLLWTLSKLKQRGLGQSIGNIPVLLIVASVLWLLRCTYSAAVGIKDIADTWTQSESNASSVLFPVLDFWVSASVLAILTIVVRRPVWAELTGGGAINGPGMPGGQPLPQQPGFGAPIMVVYADGTTHYVQPQPQPQPQMYGVPGSQPQMYQQQQQQPGVYQQQPQQQQFMQQPYVQGQQYPQQVQQPHNVQTQQQQ